MDHIIVAFVDAGYYRARISTLSEFDKIIGGMAWALQIFSYDVNIDVFYTDSLDLGQKIALSERLVMLLIALKCPYRIEPHQIVGLDYANLLPCTKWLLKKSEEIRREHEAFNRLLALRHYHRVTNTGTSLHRSQWCFTVPTKALEHGTSETTSPGASMSDDAQFDPVAMIGLDLKEKFKHNESVSFIQLPSHIRANKSMTAHGDNLRSNDTLIEDQADLSDANSDCHDEAEQVELAQNRVGQIQSDTLESICGEKQLNRELDTELLATHQKILNLLRKLDTMPNDLEISQYQRRYVELHQQLISKNRDVKKLFDLYNCLDSTKYYLMKEINLLESIASNLDLTDNSALNRNSFMRQFQDIIAKIEAIREEMENRRDVLRDRCERLNLEYAEMIDYEANMDN